MASTSSANNQYSLSEVEGIPKILYEDDHLLVLDKPAGLVVTRSETTPEDTVEDWLVAHGYDKIDRMGIVHRIDKDTSGLLLVAKTPQALENLKSQFKERVTKKQYLALVHGWVEKPGKVEGSIGRNPGNREKFTVLEDGKEAVTEYQPLENFQFSIFNFQSIFNDLNEQSSSGYRLNKIQMRKLERMKYNQFTLVTCRPLTGRTHQIRVHLKHIGFPIVADEKYVGRKMYRLDHRWCPRQFLHAAKLGFKHPASGQWMEFESELPEDLQKALDVLR